MLRFIVRRALWLLPTIVFVTFLVYCAVRIGWDPVASYKRANPRASKAKMQQYREVNGLYDGFGGYLRGYKEWLWRFVQGPEQWSRSIKGRAEVWPPLRYAIFNTLRLAGIASVVGISVGLSLGVLAARHPGGWFDTTVNTAAFFLGSIPPFVSGVVLQLVFAVQLGWLPPVGVYPPGHEGFDLMLMLKHLTLPVTVVAIQTISAYSRYMRASLLDVSSADYLRTARAKGISEGAVLRRHGVRNALIPVVTVLAIDIGALLGGLIITENIFNYPGMGVFFIRASTNGDFPQMMPYLVIIVTSVLMFNLIADLAYAYLDPRIRLE
ncbi:MAG: oligopeptide transport system permease protein [Acidimicrobiaceae bacterium]|nr:MAG: oligopeptide transport system permease protein [Acidimicrobiaceae bacterium]